MIFIYPERSEAIVTKVGDNYELKYSEWVDKKLIEQDPTITKRSLLAVKMMIPDAKIRKYGNKLTLTVTGSESFVFNMLLGEALPRSDFGKLTISTLVEELIESKLKEMPGFEAVMKATVGEVKRVDRKPCCLPLQTWTIKDGEK
jgi:hypothetical protein